MRNSEKRQAILDCLQATTQHPTAEWIYRQLKPTYPRLSLATVYRNLHQLEEAGLVRSVGIVDGQERFDGTVASHIHIICHQCGKVADIPAMFLFDELTNTAEQKTGFSVTETDIRLSGLCPHCRNPHG